MRKIAMVGTASSGANAPYDDASWEIWGVSSPGPYVTRATRWFELHRLDGEPQDWANLWRKVIKDFIKDTELLMLYPEPGLAKNLTTYPHDRIVNRFGTFFMTSTFSWMMALAIDELCPVGKARVPGEVVGEILVLGVDMEYGTEYRQQRSGLRHFIELAKHYGIIVHRIVDGGLAYEPVPYPLWQDDPLLAKLNLRSREVKRRLKDYIQTLDLTQRMIAQSKAVLDTLEEIKTKSFDLGDRIKVEERKLNDLLKTSHNISKDVVKLEGADEEQQWLMDYLQP